MPAEGSKTHTEGSKENTPEDTPQDTVNGLGDLDRDIKEELGEACKRRENDGDDDGLTYSGEVWTMEMYEKCTKIDEKVLV